MSDHGLDLAVRVCACRCQSVGSGLSTLASLMLKEHNRLAARLAALNPHWGHETLFSEARRLVAAELQHITYTEFLPTVLGEVTMESWDLTPRDHGHYTEYSSKVRAGSIAGAAVAGLHAFRSMVPASLVSNTTANDLHRMDALDQQRFTGMVQAVTASPALRPSLRIPGAGAGSRPGKRRRVKLRLSVTGCFK